MNTFFKNAFFTLLFSLFLSFPFSVSAQQSSMFRKGYRGEVEVGGWKIMQKGFTGKGITATTTHGYRLGNGIFIGGGSGFFYSITANEFEIPIFVDGKYSILDRSVSPFLSLKIGGVTAVNGLENSFFLSPAIGLDVSRFSILFGYNYEDGVVKKRDESLSKMFSYPYEAQWLFLAFAVSF